MKVERTNNRKEARRKRWKKGLRAECRMKWQERINKRRGKMEPRKMA